jgi:serine/threonine-protein kinase RsbW
MGAMTVPHSAASASLARRRIVSDLMAIHVDQTALDDVALVVSELVSNAVRHGRAVPGTGVSVGWECVEDALQLRVTDGGSPADSPHVRNAGPKDTTGRGLAVVRSLADDWGVERSADGTTVWARIVTPCEAQSTVAAGAEPAGSVADR